MPQRERYLFVCINRRADDNPKGCCASKDSELVYRALKEQLAAREPSQIKSARVHFELPRSMRDRRHDSGRARPFFLRRRNADGRAGNH